MAPRPETHLIRIPTGYASREAASFMAQLDALSESLFDDLRGVKPAELAWQPGAPARAGRGRGTNTIGMLLAHNAIVEAYWLQIAAGTYSQSALERVLGIGEDDDGMPLPPDGAPPRALAGRTLAFYRRVHDRARRHAKRLAARMTTRDLDGRVTRTRRNGQKVTTSRRWILYHVLEHQAGHYGQMLMIRHLYRDRRRKA